MGVDYRHKIIMDPVHGAIGLSDLETRILNTASFQRLRRLKQLGFASLVYPNASYSRLAHSIGVLHIASRVADVFRLKGRINETEVPKLRIAALLHDVGHYPYSHLMEYIQSEEATKRFIKRKDSQKESSSNAIYPDHDSVGKLIITHRQDIRSVLEAERIDPEEIGAIIEGKHPNLPPVLHQSLDVDRMDYLVRDSLNTGLPYGRVDLDYILNNLEVVEDGSIAIKSKAKLSAEHLLLARYCMFNAVYLHKTVFGFEELARKAIKLLAEENKIYSSKEEIEALVTGTSPEFLQFDDGYLDKLIKEHAYSQEHSSSLLGFFCRAIMDRKPPKLVYEVKDLQWDGSSQTEEYVLFRAFLKKEVHSAAKACGIDPDHLFWREPKDISFEAVHPFVAVSQITRDMKPMEVRELVRVVDRDGHISNLLEERTSLILYLCRLRAKSIRLYGVQVEPSALEKLGNLIGDHIRSLS